MQEHIIDGRKIVISEFKLSEDSSLADIMKSEAFQTFVSQVEKHVIIVLGGDGSMLEAIAKYYPENTNFLGINFGNKGFLLHDKSVLDIPQPQFETRKFPIISCQDTNKNIFYAFNELDIKASDGKMLDLKIEVNKKYSMNIQGDGILISSPAGSSGYSSSLGGPLLQHDLNCYLLTPKAPWKPRGLGPVILSNSQKLSLTSQGRETPCELYCDGRIAHIYEQHIDLKMQILPDEIQLYIESGYCQDWDNKILMEQGFTRK